MRLVTTIALLVDVLRKRVLRWRAPLVLVAGLLHDVVRGDELDRPFEVCLEAAAAHLLAAVHAFLHHGERGLVARSLDPPQILGFCTLALILYVYLRGLVDVT